VVDLPFRRLKLRSGGEPELVAENSRDWVGVRVASLSRRPVPGDGWPIEFRRADIAVRPGALVLELTPGRDAEARAVRRGP
jgi:hypothetical protein